MDQQSVVARVQPSLEVLVRSLTHANDDWEAWVPEGARLTVESARPRFIYERTLHYLEMHFGRAGAARVAEEKDLKFLLIEGDEFDVAVCVKKLDERFLSCNYFTKQQIAIRQDGVFFWMAKPTVQTFLGYRLTGGLQRSLSHIVLTHEVRDLDTGHRDVDWIQTLWTAQEGIFPFRLTQQNFTAPPLAPPKIKGKGRRGADKDEQAG